MLLAGHVGSRLHVCHVSTAGSVEILRWAKAKGWRVTAEVTPHHLLLTDDFACGYDPVYKVNPPLRTAEDVAALRDALADGTIDAVATDHAPHALEDKETEWAAARPGMLGLRDRARRRACWRSASGFSWALAAERMSYAAGADRPAARSGPAARRGRPGQPDAGRPAASWVVDPAGLARAAATPRTPARELPAPHRRDLPARAGHGAGRRPHDTALDSLAIDTMGSTRTGRQR